MFAGYLAHTGATGGLTKTEVGGTDNVVFAVYVSCFNMFQSSDSMDPEQPGPGLDLPWPRPSK